MGSTKFKITVSVKNEVLLETPQTLWFDCDQVIPLGEQVVRQYNSSECIVSRKAYLFSYLGVRFGSFDFQTLDDFINYRNTNCTIVPKSDCCILTHGGCVLTFKGVPITSDRQPISECCTLTYGGCSITYNNKLITHGRL